MSEQFANLASTTLASAYTAGAGSISLVSAAGWPIAGTFTLVIRDASTKAIKLLFRVTSVSGTTFSGASEGTDAAANAGDLVDGTMVTVASLAQFKTDILAAVPPAGNPFIQSLTTPVPGNFTAKNYNTGSGVVTTQTNNSSPVTSVTINQHDPNNTGNIVAIDKAEIAATFTLTVGFILAWGGPNQSNGAGLFLSDGGAGPNNILFGLQGNTNTGQGLVAFFFTNFTIASLSATIFHNDEHFAPPIIWVRVKETAVTRFFYCSSDGINWAQVYQEPVATHFVTTRYGFSLFSQGTGSNSPDAMATLYSFAESTP